jgi:beta-mannosidase
MEAIDNVKRLRDHPCIALWCGNNEVDEGWKNWGWQKSMNYTDEQSDFLRTCYRSLFQKLLPSIVRELNPEVAYRFDLVEVILLFTLSLIK